jgi:hypothetical protein
MGWKWWSVCGKFEVRKGKSDEGNEGDKNMTEAYDSSWSFQMKTYE